MVFPILVFALMRLNKQYRAEASVLEMSRTEQPVMARYTRHRVLVFVDAIDLAEIEAMRYGNGLHADELAAVHLRDRRRACGPAAEALGSLRTRHRAADGRLPGSATSAGPHRIWCCKVLDKHPDTRVTVLLPRRTYSAAGRTAAARPYGGQDCRAVSRIPGASRPNRALRHRVPDCRGDRRTMTLTRQSNGRFARKGAEKRHGLSVQIAQA